MDYWLLLQLKGTRQQQQFTDSLGRMSGLGLGLIPLSLKDYRGREDVAALLLEEQSMALLP